MSSDEEDELETTMASGSIPAVDAARELAAILDDLETLLKNGEIVGALSTKGINASLALVAIQGLRSLLHDDKGAAAEDFETVAEELRARQAAEPPGKKKRPRSGRGS